MRYARHGTPTCSSSGATEAKKAYAYHEGSGTKLEFESGWSFRVASRAVSFTVRALRRTSIQVRILDFRSWNRSRTCWSGLRRQPTQIHQSMQCSKSHERDSVGTPRRRRCDLPDSKRWTVERMTSGPRRARRGIAASGGMIQLKGFHNCPLRPAGMRWIWSFGSWVCGVSRMVSVLRGWHRKQ